MCKRIADFFFSLLGLIVLGPFLVLIGLIVWFTDRGPVFYRGQRVGLFAEEFALLKFRTMVVNAEKIGGPTTAGDDPRMTRIGGLLRRFKLDELPQLINVLKGDMSFVGPRPEVESEVHEYSAEQRRVLDIRPGITDYASLWNSDEGAVLAGAADAHAAYKRYIQPTKLQLQLKYLEERSFWLDTRLVFYTLLKIFRKNWVPQELREFPPPSIPTAELVREEAIKG